MTFGEIMAAQIRQKLTVELAPISLEIIDDSNAHAGHGNAAPGGGTHFTVNIVSAAFQGLNRPARHRLVYAALSDEFEGRLHALSISTKTPEET